MSHAAKTALITGATSGIGLTIAIRLARAGYGIIVHGLETEAAVASALADIAAANPRHLSYCQADLRDPGQIERMMATLEASDTPDILINNAGIQNVAPIESFPPDIWDAMVAVNLSASFHTIRLALPGMRARGWGRIVNIASVSGLVATAGKAPYVATKHGLVGLTKAVALETANSAITCNAVCPGWVLTPLVQKQVDVIATRDALSPAEAVARLLGAKQPSQAFVEADDVAAIVEFLCSPAAAQVRGATWTIDGGYVAA
ncbi:MAG TPA: 3-hydroxybutyrate dehydrogenase [Devosia sp.]|nr:3-hydroxybutyrate dehydrogenase [Devosia sp.]